MTTVFVKGDCREPDAEQERFHARVLVNNARKIATYKHRSERNWFFVMLLFGVGSTRAVELCQKWGIDPNDTTWSDA